MSKKSVERFSNRVENYVRYRPGYPSQIIKLFQTEMNLRPSSVIADIGSGTGISSKIFLENGNRVLGIEPNEAMRSAAEIFLKDFPEFVNINGTAENTTLADKSVDFISAAQAFHWFDKSPTRFEFKRILKNDGFIALIWNERQLNTNRFLRDYEQILIEFGTDYEKVRHDNITKQTLRDFFQKDFREAIFQNSQLLDFDGFKGRILSSSYMPSAENPNFESLIKKLQSLFAEHEENGKIEVLYDTKVFYGQI